MVIDYRSLHTLLFILTALVLAGCSDHPESCSDFSSISFPTDYAYTGDEYTINGSFCGEGSLFVLLNGLQAEVVDLTNNKLTFIIPKLTDKKVDVRLSYNSEVIDLNKELEIFPGGGTWTEKASFTGNGQFEMYYYGHQGKGYFLAGHQYLGYDESHRYEEYKELHAYDAENNNWSLLKTDVGFGVSQGMTAGDGKLFNFTSGHGAATTYTLSTGELDETESLPNWAYSDFTGFTYNDHAYIAYYSNDEESNRILIYQYDVENNGWTERVNQPITTTAEAYYFFIDFTIATEDHKQLFFLRELNNHVPVQVFEFNPATQLFTKIKEVTYPTTRMRHLFTLGDLAYFTAHPIISITTENISFNDPNDHDLFIFNLKKLAFKTVDHVYPEKLYHGVSYTLNGKGYAGLPVTKGASLLNYSNKIYLFTPN